MVVTMEWTPIISVLSALSGVLLGWLGFARTQKSQTHSEAAADALLRTDVEYIKRGVDEIRVEQRAQKKEFDVLTERVTRVEESAKQAHKRLDGLDK